MSASRRVRHLACTAHASLLAISEVGEKIVDFLTNVASETQFENIFGTWLLALNDVDRQVNLVANRSWKETIVVRGSEDVADDPAHAKSKGKVILDVISLANFIQRAALDPGGVYLYFNPVAPPVPLSVSRTAHLKDNNKGSRSTPSKGKGGKGPSSVQSFAATPGGDETPRSSGKGDDQEESETDRKARLRIAALGGAKWILGMFLPLTLSKYRTIIPLRSYHIVLRTF